jgi:hypothetical protein
LVFACIRHPSSNKLAAFFVGKFGKTSPATLRAGSQPHRFDGYRNDSCIGAATGQAGPIEINAR